MVVVVLQSQAESFHVQPIFTQLHFSISSAVQPCVSPLATLVQLHAGVTGVPGVIVREVVVVPGVPGVRGGVPESGVFGVSVSSVIGIGVPVGCGVFVESVIVLVVFVVVFVVVVVVVVLVTGGCVTGRVACVPRVAFVVVVVAGQGFIHQLADGVVLPPILHDALQTFGLAVEPGHSQ